MLICSVFAIPLAIFAVKLALGYHEQAQEAQASRQGLAYLQKTNLLIQELETLRDLKVIISWKNHPGFIAKHERSREDALNLLSHLIRETHAHSNIRFLSQLQLRISEDNQAIGMESGSLDAVYQDAQDLVEQLYHWRSKQSYQSISFTQHNTHILSIINLLNETSNYTQVLGKARTFGGIYLAQQFVDSYGGQLLEKTYQELAQLMKVLDVKSLENDEFFSAYPQAKLDKLKRALLLGQSQLYQQLIAATEANSDPSAYFNQLSGSFGLIYQYNAALFGLAKEIIEQDYVNSIERLQLFYISALGIALLLSFLAAGLYHSIAVTVTELLKSAARFSAGKYDKPVKIMAQDELAAVAEAMDTMRLNIKEREEKLALMSQTDGLTKLSNRKFFDQALQISLANSRRNLTPLTIVMMDIDFFKKVNDQYGHLAGDDCLVQVAKLMKNKFKRLTDVNARYGGEEFIAILYGQSLNEAKAQAEKLREEIAGTLIHSGDVRFRVTASFGLACLQPPQEANAHELVALADAMLYKSKDNGRNCIHGAVF